MRKPKLSKRKRGERLPEGKARKEILRFLLTSQNPTTTDIKRYLRQPDINIRNSKTVVQHLNALKEAGLIVSTIPKKGLSATWAIPKSLETLRKIAEQYPELIPEMQKQKWIVELLYQAYSPRDICGLSCTSEAQTSQDYYFRKYLPLSITFFKLHLEHSGDPKSLTKQMGAWYSIEKDAEVYRDKLHIDSKNKVVKYEVFLYGQYIIDLVKKCVFHDYFTNQHTQEEVDTWKKESKSILEADRLVKENLTAENKFNFLEKYVFPHLRAELQEKLKPLLAEYDNSPPGRLTESLKHEIMVMKKIEDVL